MKQLARNFGISFSISLATLLAVFIFLGFNASLVALILAVIELSLSLDNAVINAQLLTRLSLLWRRLFLSVGIVVAVFGVRTLLPITIVSLTTHLSLGTVAALALHHPWDYANKLTQARPGINAFGGAFLMMIALRFFMTKRDILWWTGLERQLGKLAIWWLPLAAIGTITILLAGFPFNHHHSARLIFGFLGIVTYILMSGITILMGDRLESGVNRVGWSAFATFLYLELLDASLSFDGVFAAFAITNQVVLMAVGLGIGALWVRSMTLHLVRHRTLETYPYLGHGANYTIAILAIAMLLDTVIEIPNLLISVACVGLIVASIISSRRRYQNSNSRLNDAHVI